LKVTPDHPRMVHPATFAPHIVDNAGKPVENAQVSGSLTMTLMDMGKTAVKFEPKGNGDYEATVPSFDMSGPWELAVDASQGTLHSHQVFQVTVLD
jgi:nitrogen fixation protein FixH